MKQTILATVSVVALAASTLAFTPAQADAGISIDSKSAQVGPDKKGGGKKGKKGGKGGKKGGGKGGPKDCQRCDDPTPEPEPEPEVPAGGRDVTACDTGLRVNPAYLCQPER